MSSDKYELLTSISDRTIKSVIFVRQNIHIFSWALALLLKGFRGIKSVWGCLQQGCINRSGMGACGVSSEHVENMEMFSCSPT